MKNSKNIAVFSLGLVITSLMHGAHLGSARIPNLQGLHELLIRHAYYHPIRSATAIVVPAYIAGSNHVLGNAWRKLAPARLQNCINRAVTAFKSQSRLAKGLEVGAVAASLAALWLFRRRNQPAPSNANRPSSSWTAPANAKRAGVATPFEQAGHTVNVP